MMRRRPNRVALSAAAAVLALTAFQQGVPATTGGYLGYRVRAEAIQARAHRVFISGQSEAYALLRTRNAIRNEFDYGSYRMLLVDPAAAGEQLLRTLPTRAGQDRLLIAGVTIDTTDPAAAFTTLPHHLVGAGRRSNAGAGLYLVQFVGPIRDQWLDAVIASGATLVSYVAENGYVVRADDVAANRLIHLVERFGFVQFVGDYSPAFRLAPSLRAGDGGSRVTNVMVQVVDSPSASATIDALRRIASITGDPVRGSGFFRMDVTLERSRLPETARLLDVFSIDEKPAGLVRYGDEAQAQIMAGNRNGNLAGGPGYLSWLAGKGFNKDQFGSFAVNVVDDAYSLTGEAAHPDLPASRVAFENNVTGMSGAQGGHGYLNAHIIGGFNDQTGSRFEDSRGFNYGLGIAPFARVGLTSIFGIGPATPTQWENAAYADGARISSNSWGFTGTAARRYDATAQEYDRIVRDAQPGVAGLQEMIVVFAAGTGGSAAGTVSSPGTAKNVITVAIGENDRQTGMDGCGVPNTGADSVNDLIGYSSRGPVNSAGGDGRVKPDISVPGTHIQGGIPPANYDGSSVCNKFFPPDSTSYAWTSSHAAAAVSGAAALVYQHFLNAGRPAPSPAMVKSVLQNSATRMTGVGANDTLPSNNQGMGRVNLGVAFDSVPRILVDQTQTFSGTGETFFETGAIADPNQPLRVTLVWTDAPGPTTGAPWVNDLDLEVTVAGTTYKGNVFSGGVSIAGGTADPRNNSESVFLPPGVTGDITVEVRASNIAGDGVPGNGDTTDQDFALVIYNGTEGGQPVPPAIGLSPVSFSFSATAGGANPATQTLNISNTGGGTLNYSASDNATWLTVNPGSGTAPSAVTLSVNIAGLVAGTYNATVTITAAGASNSPQNVPVTLAVNAAVPPTIGLSPTSFSFSATAGGANPATQTLNISNTGGGTLNYSASDNATWLTVNPGSGTAPSAVTLSVNIAGLVAGTYNATVTITAAGASNSPQNVAVTLSIAPAGLAAIREMVARVRVVIADLPEASFDTTGHQVALGEHLEQILRLIDRSQLRQAAMAADRSIENVDQCGDWIVNCVEQQAVHVQLLAARNAMQGAGR